MILRDRMVDEFIELAKIDSLTRQERQMADRLKAKLSAMGLEVYEDKAGEAIGGNAGNLYCTVRGTKAVAPVLLMAHMDTVEPGLGKKPSVEGDYIVTDGTTVLGGDDLAGVESILEVLRVLKEDGIPHGDIQVVFSIAEEGGLHGAKNMDYSRIYAEYGFVLDSSGAIGHVAVRAPSQNRMFYTIRGRAAHAGIEPEKGISAIAVAAEGIAAMKLGRIDEETTANVGVIHGGLETNIVCDTVELRCEARSRDQKKLDTQTAHMTQALQNACDRWGATLEAVVREEYRAFSIPEDAPVCDILRRASESCGIPLKLFATGGGSDTNIINSHGISGVDVAIGMDRVHSVNERLKIEDLVNSARFLLAIVQNVQA